MKKTQVGLPKSKKPLERPEFIQLLKTNKNLRQRIKKKMKRGNWKEGKSLAIKRYFSVSLFDNTNLTMLTNKIYPVFAKLFNGTLLEFSVVVVPASCDKNVFVLVELVIALQNRYLFCNLIVAAANADIERVKNVQFQPGCAAEREKDV